MKRVGEWLDLRQRDAGLTIVVTHPNVIRAAVVNAIGAPAASFNHIGIPPLSRITFSAYNGTWRVLMGIGK